MLLVVVDTMIHSFGDDLLILQDARTSPYPIVKVIFLVIYINFEFHPTGIASIGTND